MRDLMANGGSQARAADDDAEPVWSEQAIAHIEAVLLELEEATPVLADAPQEFRKYLVRAHTPPPNRALVSTSTEPHGCAVASFSGRSSTSRGRTSA